jgi:hypothetical protein
MVDTRVARWVKENHNRHNTADRSAPRLVTPARYLRVPHATVLTLADSDFVEAWTAWCRYTAEKLSGDTGHHWGRGTWKWRSFRQQGRTLRFPHADPRPLLPR